MRFQARRAAPICDSLPGQQLVARPRRFIVAGMSFRFHARMPAVPSCCAGIAASCFARRRRTELCPVVVGLFEVKADDLVCRVFLLAPSQSRIRLVELRAVDLREARVRDVPDERVIEAVELLLGSPGGGTDEAPADELEELCRERRRAGGGERGERRARELAADERCALGRGPRLCVEQVEAGSQERLDRRWHGVERRTLRAPRRRRAAAPRRRDSPRRARRGARAPESRARFRARPTSVPVSSSLRGSSASDLLPAGRSSGSSGPRAEEEHRLARPPRRADRRARAAPPRPSGRPRARSRAAAGRLARRSSRRTAQKPSSTEPRPLRALRARSLAVRATSPSSDVRERRVEVDRGKNLAQGQVRGALAVRDAPTDVTRLPLGRHACELTRRVGSCRCPARRPATTTAHRPLRVALSNCSTSEASSGPRPTSGASTCWATAGASIWTDSRRNPPRLRRPSTACPTRSRSSAPTRISRRLRRWSRRAIRVTSPLTKPWPVSDSPRLPTRSTTRPLPRSPVAAP